MRSRLASVSIFVLLLGVLLTPSPTHGADGLSFLTIGNWGDGTAVQQQIATGMASVATSNAPLSFVISTGNNFLPAGIPTNASDSKFDTSFESVYRDNSLQVGWYLTLGSRDYSGNANAQLSYPAVEPAPPVAIPDTTNKKRWQMSSAIGGGAFHTLSRSIDTASTANFVFIDTQILIAQSAASDPKEYNDMFGWITTQLSTFNSKTGGAISNDWLFVVGHHPVYTLSGTDTVYHPVMKKLLDLMDQYRVDAYFCGHDSLLQHFTAVSAAGTTSSASGVELYTSGTGSSYAEDGNMQMLSSNRAYWAPTAVGDEVVSPFKFGSTNRGFIRHSLSAGGSMTTTFYGVGISGVATAPVVLYAHMQYPRRAYVGSGSSSGVSKGEIAVLAMCFVFVLGVCGGILVFSYRQWNKDRAAAAASALNLGGGAGNSSSGGVPGVLGDGKFETMAVVSSSEPASSGRDSKSDL